MPISTYFGAWPPCLNDFRLYIVRTYASRAMPLAMMTAKKAMHESMRMGLNTNNNNNNNNNIYLYHKEIKDKSNTLVLKLINKVLAAYNNHNGCEN